MTSCSICTFLKMPDLTVHNTWSFGRAEGAVMIDRRCNLGRAGDVAAHSFCSFRDLQMLSSIAYAPKMKLHAKP